MTRFLVLDSGPLGMAANPRGTGDFPAWYRSVTSAEIDVVVPEIADYEVRRELILAGLELSLARLAAVRAAARFEPITSEIMLAAARIWAEA
ncbi:MAG: nucleic acid-binding protein, partial [Dehalococcoidia bacterium]